MPKPKLVVFDLDMTLWPYWITGGVDPPYLLRNEKPCNVIGSAMECFPESTQVLQYLNREGYTLALASRLNGQSGIAYSEMLFFDDEERWREEARKLGVVTAPVDEGISFITIHGGLQRYERMRK